MTATIEHALGRAVLNAIWAVQQNGWAGPAALLDYGHTSAADPGCVAVVLDLIAATRGTANPALPDAPGTPMERLAAFARFCDGKPEAVHFAERSPVSGDV